ncbi:MAG: cytochrome b N-terminal domain-containing protein [Gemmatimonadaceae bacterium]|nr:cytochrome b N-terminal domain-containing protein [Gemmatimonadaceae bacterium]
MGRITRWMDERIGLADLRRTLLDREVPSRLTWWHTLGSATLAAFLVQVVTGAVLATFYSPSPDHAYDSVRYIEGVVRGGSFVRGMHRWAASFMVVLVLAHMVRVFSMGAYKYPREVNWALGVILFVLVMGFGFTGYLLPWDQKAYWATQVGTSMAGTMPFVGAMLAGLLRGGPELGAATLTRFYALHVIWLPLALGGLIALHMALVVRQGIAPRTATLEGDAPARTTSPGYADFYRERYKASKQAGVRFWPDIIGKDVVVATAVILLIAVLAATIGAGLEAPADATDTSYVPRPEWYFLPIFQLLTLVPGNMESIVALGVPAALVLALLALPFFDTRSRRSLRHRPVAIVSLVVLLGGASLLVGASVRADAGLSRPEPGGVALSSVQRAGRAIFAQQQCGSCHLVRDEGGDKGPDLSEEGLHRSAGWLHSFLEQPKRFHPDSDMPAFGPPVLSHQEIEELAQYLTTLRGLPGSVAKPDIHDTFPELAPPR